MAYPTIPYDATYGSDSNPSDCVASGTTTSKTVSATGGTTVISFSASVDLSGCNQDGSDYIWVDGNSGQRHLFKIVEVYSGSWAACDSITVTPAVGATAISGSDWHVNGTRQTLKDDSSNNDARDYCQGWSATFEEGTYVIDQALYPGYNIAASSITLPITIRAATGVSSKPVIQTNSSVQLLISTYACVYAKGLKFLASTGSGSNSYIHVQNGGFGTILEDCVVDVGSYATRAIYLNTSIKFFIAIGCYITGGTSYGIEGYNVFASKFLFNNCVVDGQSETYHSVAGIYARTQTNTEFICRNTLVVGSGGDGIYIYPTTTSTQDSVLDGITVVDCGGNGIYITGSAVTTIAPLLMSNLLCAYNGGYGIQLDSTDPHLLLVDYNCFYSNTSGALSGLSAGDHDVTLSGDPFTDRAGGDYTLDPTAGADLIGAGYPGSNAWPNGS